jgi:hypothetical protein
VVYLEFNIRRSQAINGQFRLKKGQLPANTPTTSNTGQ